VRYRIDRGQRRRFRATCSPPDGQSLLDLLSVALIVIDRDARLDAPRRRAAPPGRGRGVRVRPIRTAKTTGTYGAPRGLEGEIGGLPYHREGVTFGVGAGVSAVISYWTFSDEERALIAAGGNLELEILGEPIPPVALRILDEPEVPA
jgi:hypothetical protein